MGLPDDCEELETLRHFRDDRKARDPAFKDLVDEYYRIAPRIVESINNRENAQEIYSSIYNELVAPCVNLIKQGKEDAAIDLYMCKVRSLEALFGDRNA